MELYDEFLHIVETLSATPLEYAICGGLAVTIHGFPRFTQDIDILVREEDLPEVLRTVASLGFVFPAKPMTFKAGSETERKVQRVSKIEGSEILTLDLLIVTPVLHNVWEDREDFSWQGHTLTVISKEGLIAMKRLAGRPKDRIDLEALGAHDEDDEVC